MQTTKATFITKIATLAAQVEALKVTGTAEALREAKKLTKHIANWTEGMWVNDLQEAAYVLQGFGHRVTCLVNSDNLKEVCKMHKSGMTVAEALNVLLAQRAA